MMKQWLGFTFILYLAAAGILFFWANPKKAQLRRLDVLSDYSDYPISFNKSTREMNYIAFRQSLRYYKNLSVMYPTLPQPDEMVAYCYFCLKDYARSRVWLLKALKIYPRQVWVIYDLGVTAYDQGDYQQALKYFQEVLQGKLFDQLGGAFLSKLSKLSPEDRKHLFSLIPVFVIDVRQGSSQMINRIYGRMAGNTDTQRAEFVLYPWWYFIPPGKEMLFN